MHGLLGSAAGWFMSGIAWVGGAALAAAPYLAIAAIGVAAIFMGRAIGHAVIGASEASHAQREASEIPHGPELERIQKQHAQGQVAQHVALKEAVENASSLTTRDRDVYGDPIEETFGGTYEDKPRNVPPAPPSSAGPLVFTGQMPPPALVRDAVQKGWAAKPLSEASITITAPREGGPVTGQSVVTLPEFRLGSVLDAVLGAAGAAGGSVGGGIAGGASLGTSSGSTENAASPLASCTSTLAVTGTYVGTYDAGLSSMTGTWSWSTTLVSDLTCASSVPAADRQKLTAGVPPTTTRGSWTALFDGVSTLGVTVTAAQAAENFKADLRLRR